MTVAENVSALELDEYQHAARTVLRHPLITAAYPDKTSLPLVRKWSAQLRADFAETLGYTLVGNGDTVRLRRVQDELDTTRPAMTRGKRPFDRRRYAYLVLTLSAIGRSGNQIALSELADAVAADAGRIDGLGMDTERKPDRDAFVDAVSWLETRGALHMADGSATDWINDPGRAEALYDIDREAAGAIYAPSRVLQHLNSVTDLLGDAASAGPAQGVNAERRRTGRRARRLVLEHPVVYYADVDDGLRGQLRAPALAEDLERLTGLPLERRAEGVALINIGSRLTDVTFPGTGTVAQTALLLCARIAGHTGQSRGRVEHLPAATAAERLADLSARIDGALPLREGVAALLAESGPASDSGETDSGELEEAGEPADAAYPFLSESWLRTETRKLVSHFRYGMSERQTADPDGLLDDALDLLAATGLVRRTGGGVLVLPALARYRGVTAQVKEPKTQIKETTQ